MRIPLKGLLCAGAGVLLALAARAEEDLSQYRDLWADVTYASATAGAVRLETRTSSETWTAEDEASGVTIEEGRLTGERVWTADTIHVVSNWVTVATDASLTIEPGTIVTFTADTGIRVEDGGFLELEGAEDACVELKTLSDERDQASIYVMPYGHFSDNGYVETRKVTVCPWATLNAVDVHAIELAGMAYVYVTVSGMRDSPFSLDWEIAGGTAQYGTDYIGETSGTLEWESSSDGTKSFAIPLVVDTVQEPAENIVIAFTAARGVNYTRDTSEVTVVDSKIVTLAASLADSPASPSARLDTRASLGGVLACGQETLGRTDGGAASVWDTTAEADGWIEKTDGAATANLLVRNDLATHVVEGRLAADTTWTNGATYLVRNWVTVPADLTLTVEAGAVVKFTADTGIRVEAGGKLDVRDTATQKVVFTMAEDDTVGGDSDLRSVTPARQDVWIQIMDYGMFAENANLEIRNLDVNRWGGVSVQDARVLEQTQRAFVPVTLSTDRTTSFSFDWIALDGTATYGDDYALAAGTMTWTGSSEGTKFIEIPIAEDILDEASEDFTIRITALRGVNLVRESAQVTIVDSDLKIAALSMAESAPSVAARIDGRSTFGAYLAHGVEKVGSVSGATVRDWDTAAEEDGVHEVKDSDASRDILTLNAPGVDIEEGRLSASVTWTNGTVHLLRNWVVVPSGVTLTIEGGAIVKFSEDTGIRVEDGGQLVSLDSAASPVVFASRADDTAGGDTDRREDAPVDLGETVDVMPSGTFTENGYLEMRGMTSSTYGTVSVSDARSIESTGMVFVPVTVGGSRNTTFAINWEAVDGSAKHGSDYTVKAGTLRWTGTSEGTKFIEIPLVADSEMEDPESFTVRVVSTCGMNIARSSGAVEIVDNALVVTNADIACADADAVRLDQRTTLGGRLVCGVEKYGSSTGGVATVWDTAAIADGWTEIADDVESAVAVLVRNDAGVRIEEGRLTADATWTAEAVHVVRNWVVVPRGVTLAIAEGAVVKFTEDTGIRIEDGGQVVAAGSEARHVAMTHVADDDAGGNTDVQDAGPVELGEVIDVMPSGSFDENGYVETRWMTSGSYGTATPHDAIAAESTGVARIPVTITGSRDRLFSVEWVVTAGSATEGNDYTLATGRLSWTGTSEGTKFIEVPLVVDDTIEPREHFTLHLKSGCGINHARETVTVQITDSPLVTAGLSVASGASPAVRIDGRTTTGGRLASGVEKVGKPDGGAATTWNTTQSADGWTELSEGGETVSVLVRNDVSVRIEEGRLTADAGWSNDVVRIVRNWVTVPSGVTLTIGNEAVVKFTEDTGILVEPGGTLVALGTAAKPSVLTVIADDAAGGDSDLREEVPADNGRTVRILSGGTFTETGGVETRHLTCDGFGSIAIHAAQAYEDLGVAYVPITVSGSRNKAFTAYWSTKDGTAACGDDFTLAAGRITWSAASQGTKFIAIPLVTDGGGEPNERFTVALTGAAGMNIESASAEVAIIDNAIGSGHAPGLGAVEPWTADIVTNDVLHDAQLVVTISTTWNDTGVAASFARLRLIPEIDPTVTNELYSIAAPATASYALDAASFEVGLYRLVHEVCDVYGNVLSRQESKVRIFDDPNVMRVVMPEGVTNFSEAVWLTEKPDGLDDENGWLYSMEGTLIISNAASTRLVFDRNAWIGKLKIVNAPGATLTIDVSSFSRVWPSQLDFSGAQGGVVFDVDYRELAASAIADVPATNWLWNSFTNLVAVVGTEHVRAPALPNGYSMELDVVPFSLDGGGAFGLRMIVTAPDAAQTPGEIVETDIQTLTQNARGENVLRIAQEGRTRDLTVAGDWTNHLAGLTVDASTFRSTGGNGIPVWQSYVLGVDPFEEKPVNEQIVATIAMNADGSPDVRVEPDMRGDGNRNPFLTYTILGKHDLDAKQEWHKAGSGDCFFKIQVEIGGRSETP